MRGRADEAAHRGACRTPLGSVRCTAAHGAASNEPPREGSRVEFRGTYKGPTKAREHIVLDVVVEPGSRWVQCLAGLEHTKAVGNIPLDSSIVVTGRPLAERPATFAECTYTLAPR